MVNLPVNRSSLDKLKLSDVVTSIHPISCQRTGLTSQRSGFPKDRSSTGLERLSEPPAVTGVQNLVQIVRGFCFATSVALPLPAAAARSSLVPVRVSLIPSALALSRFAAAYSQPMSVGCSCQPFQLTTAVFAAQLQTCLAPFVWKRRRSDNFRLATPPGVCNFLRRKIRSISQGLCFQRDRTASARRAASTPRNCASSKMEKPLTSAFA